MHNLASGIVAAPVLPFKEDGAIDWPTLERYIAEVAAGRPRAIAMNMAVSEVSSLELDEQLEVIKRCKAVLAGSCALVSGLSVTHTAAARTVSKKLVDAGAEGIVVFPPMPAFMGGVTVPMIESYHRAVAESVDVPILAFQTFFASYPKGAITALSSIPSVVSIKDASFNVDHTSANVIEAAAAPRRIGILTGSDTFILEAMLMGCDGALVGLAATATAELVRMHELAQGGAITEAYEIWNRIGPLARICWRAPLRDYRVRTKYVLVKQGVLPNYRMRDPFPTITEADRVDIDNVYRSLDLGESRFLPAGRPSGSQAKQASASRAASLA
jgi:4-hydroxy-tetrahydrodipicolinate synthase